MREFFELECTQCRRRNYTSRKNRKAHPERLELVKFCSACRRHTVHRERK